MEEAAGGRPPRRTRARRERGECFATVSQPKLTYSSARGHGEKRAAGRTAEAGDGFEPLAHIASFRRMTRVGNLREVNEATMQLQAALAFIRGLGAGSTYLSKAEAIAKVALEEGLRRRHRLADAAAHAPAIEAAVAGTRSGHATAPCIAVAAHGEGTPLGPPTKRRLTKQERAARRRAKAAALAGHVDGVADGDHPT